VELEAQAEPLKLEMESLEHLEVQVHWGFGCTQVVALKAQGEPLPQLQFRQQVADPLEPSLLAQVEGLLPMLVGLKHLATGVVEATQLLVAEAVLVAGSTLEGQLEMEELEDSNTFTTEETWVLLLSAKMAFLFLQISHTEALLVAEEMQVKLRLQCLEAMGAFMEAEVEEEVQGKALPVAQAATGHLASWLSPPTSNEFPFQAPPNDS
jgi:hypothetical protein